MTINPGDEILKLFRYARNPVRSQMYNDFALLQWFTGIRLHSIMSGLCYDAFSKNLKVENGPVNRYQNARLVDR